jgi:hypothetical protein
MGKAKKEILRLRQAEIEAENANLVNKAETAIEKIVAQDAMGQDEPLTYLEDVTRYGGQSGMIPGMVYYTDTTAFYQTHKDEIWEMLSEDNEDMGEGGNIIAFIGTFNGAANVGSAEQFENLLAWYAYERAARKLLDRMGGDS